MSLPIKALKNEIYDEKIEVATINHGGKEYKIEFFPVFKYEKIRKLVLEIGQFFQNVLKEKLEIDELEEDEIVNYFIIKYFSTGLKFTTSKKSKSIYEEFKVFYNSDLYKVFKDEIFTSELVENSKEDVYNEIFANIELAAKFNKKIQQLQNNIKNLDIIKSNELQNK